jgi:hypothetical protein
MVLIVFGLFCGALATIPSFLDRTLPRPEQLLGPVFACVGLTAVVWFLMLTFRNGAILSGLAKSDYYSAYQASHPADWVERPARTFNNLMQVPSLFYVVCLAMIVMHTADRTQLAYAWLFTLLRAAHAVIYIGWNYLPLRFISWVMSFVTLCCLWVRFAVEVWPTLW